ncbi:MAG: TolC family protein [Prevotella sp.]|jgi:outer membrane protein TolC|nr:TolC family protein [Prevotella sp.]
MRKIFLAVFVSITSCLVLQAQMVHHLTLDESIEIAKEQSLSMQRLQQNLKIAEFNLKIAKNRLKTNVNLSFTLPNYTETIREYEDSTGFSYYAVKQLDYSTQLRITQPLPTDGNVYVTTNLRGLNDYNTDIRSTNFSTRVGFEQPLDAFYGYNSIRTRLKEAELNYEQTSKSLKREELNLIYSVSSSYYNLLSSQRTIDISKSNMERQNEAYEISKNKYEAGLIREVDALQMEVDLAQAQNDYDIAVYSQTSSANAFKELIGLNLADSIALNNEMKYDPIIVDPLKAVQYAKENRLEIREQEIQIELQKLAIKSQKAQGMIKSSINGYFEKAGVSRTDVGDSFFGSSIDKSFSNFRDRPMNYGIGLTISIPILDWGVNRSQVRVQEARLKQNMISKEEIERGIETEVLNLAARINSNLKQLQLLERSATVAEKSFEITLKRYSDGDIDSQSLALERDRLNRAYSTHLSAYISYQLSLADLMRKTFYDFKNDRVIE